MRQTIISSLTKRALTGAVSVYVLFGSFAHGAETPRPTLDITLAHGNQQEQQTKQQLLRLLAAHPVSQYLFTHKIVIESGYKVVPHSHPTLTLSTKRLKDDELLLSTFIHEQLHWYLEAKPDETTEAVAEIRKVFPELPVGFPEGADTEQSSYEHIVVCYLDYQADKAVFGALRARQIMEFWASDHYTKIYQSVLHDEDKIGDIVRRHKLLPEERI